MRVYHFSENPYPAAWNADPSSLRVRLPNRHFDPQIGADLLNRYIDEWSMCDELGLDIWVNEHHSTPTCLTASTMLTLGILARETKRSRLLTLGVPIAIRHDPLLVAEEAAYIDVLSRGRLELGLVKGYPSEVAPANVNPAHVSERFWEAHDLILKALTEHDGAFNWEGIHFQYRHVNIWPRAFQNPHPPIWITTFSPSGAIAIADRGYVVAGGLSARAGRDIFQSYRARVKELGRPAPALDRFAYMALVAVGETEAEGHQIARQIKGYLETSGKIHPAFLSPPGYLPVQARVAEYRSSRQGAKLERAETPSELASSSIPELINAGVLCAGTPDQVFEQIKNLYEYVGGFEHLLAMMHGGALSHELTAKNLTLFGREVLPRLSELTDSTFDLPDSGRRQEFAQARLV